MSRLSSVIPKSTGGKTSIKRGVHSYYEVAGNLLVGKVGVLLDQLFDPPDEEVFAEEWCRGYILGMSLREDEWKPAIEDEEISVYLAPIFAIADPKETGMEKPL